ncbi:MAG: Mov34/MPN/PAD-1 family protein [Candidatus Woesearchaeota archaeon]|nr:MAG: Mov34/MPN/PAD-1 family protein [Candidatus Woesearchaeota archaeon]
MKDIFKITPYAREKALTYASLIGDKEYIGFLLRPLDDEREITQDVVLGEVSKSGSFVKIRGDNIVHVLNQAYNEGNEPIGWLHSHAKHSTYFSSKDVEEMEKDAIHDFSPVTLRTIIEQIQAEQVVEDDLTKLIIGDAFEIECKKEIPNIYQKRSIARVWGYVVNANGNEYAEVAKKEYCNSCHTELISPTKKVDILVEDLHDNRKVDTRKIEDEVKAKTYKPLLGFKRRKVAPLTEEDKLAFDFTARLADAYQKHPKNLSKFKNLLQEYCKSAGDSHG